MMEANVVMDNINISCALIKKCGASAVETLNLDGSLEQLLQIDAKLITAERSLEGLGEAAKKAWLLLKEWFFRALSFILTIMSWIFKLYGAMHTMWGAVLTAVGELLNQVDDATFLAVAARARYKRRAMEGRGAAEYLLSHPIISIKLMDLTEGHLRSLEEATKNFTASLSPDKVKAYIEGKGENGIETTINNTKGTMDHFAETLSDWLEQISSDMESTASAKDKGYTNQNQIIKTIKDCERRSETAAKISTNLNNFCNNIDKQKDAMLSGLSPDDAEFQKKRSVIMDWTNTCSTLAKVNQRMAKAISAMFGTCRGGLTDLAKLASKGITAE